MNIGRVSCSLPSLEKRKARRTYARLATPLTVAHKERAPNRAAATCMDVTLDAWMHLQPTSLHSHWASTRVPPTASSSYLCSHPRLSPTCICSTKSTCDLVQATIVNTYCTHVRPWTFHTACRIHTGYSLVWTPMAGDVLPARCSKSPRYNIAERILAVWRGRGVLENSELLQCISEGFHCPRI